MDPNYYTITSNQTSPKNALLPSRWWRHRPYETEMARTRMIVDSLTMELRSPHNQYHNDV
jgi:hypothetical protein